MSIRVLVTADNHLDPPATAFAAKRLERRRDHQRCFEEVLEYARRNKPDALLICGDVFDTIRPGNSIRAWVMDRFRVLHEAGVRIFLVSGEHDTPKSVEEGLSPLAVYGNSGYAYYFRIDDKKPVRFNVRGHEISVAGISYDPFLADDANPLEKIRFESGSDLNILMTHYPTHGFTGYFGNAPAIEPTKIPQGLGLLVSGHLHKHQVKKVDGTTIVYPGSTERTSFQEEGEEKGFVWLELGPAGVESLQRLRTSAREFRTVETDFPVSNPLDALKQLLNHETDLELVFRLRLKGRVNLERLAEYRRSELLLYGAQKFFHLSIEESGLEIETPEPVQASAHSTPLEELRRYFEVKSQAVENPEEREILAEAFKLAETRLREAGAW